MGLQEIIDAAEAVGKYDDIRESAFREEFQRYEEGETESFPRTRDAIADERDALDELAAQLDVEDGRIDELIENTEFLSVDQAVRHRKQVVEKLEAHNEHLRTFHDAMVVALDKVETNLAALESDGPHAVEEDPEHEFDRAHDSLEAHNRAVEDLDTNLTILNAYLQ